MYTISSVVAVGSTLSNLYKENFSSRYYIIFINSSKKNENKITLITQSESSELNLSKGRLF